MATPREVQCNRITKILRDAGRDYETLFDDPQSGYIRLTVKHAGTILLNPSSGHLTVEGIASKSDEEIKQLLTSLSHELITF